MTIEKLDILNIDKGLNFSYRLRDVQDKINELTDAVNILKLNVADIFKWINKQNHCGDDCECSEENKFNSQETDSADKPLVKYTSDASDSERSEWSNQLPKSEPRPDLCSNCGKELDG